MNGFVFNASKGVICKPGAIAELGSLCRQIIGQRVLIVTDRGIVKAGLLKPVLEALQTAGIEPLVFDAVLADPAESIVLAATALATEHAIEGVIGLGGGSSWMWPSWWRYWPRARSRWRRSTGSTWCRDSACH